MPFYVSPPTPATLVFFLTGSTTADLSRLHLLSNGGGFPGTFARGEAFQESGAAWLGGAKVNRPEVERHGQFNKNSLLVGDGFKVLFSFHPENWGNDPI